MISDILPKDSLLAAYCRNNPYARQGQGGTSQGASERKEEIILRHLPMVKYLALHLASRLPADVSAEDLFNAGIIGLMDAIDRYDPNQQSQFKTYAKIRVKGAMLDEIRSMDWIPRSLRQKSHSLETTTLALTDRLGREPTDEEVAEALGITIDAYYKLLDELKGISLLPVEIMDALQESKTEEKLGTHQDGPFQNVYREQIRRMLSEAITSLPKNEQLVLSLYYYEELTMKEIGLVLGYTESRISQLHTKAILRLRTKLARKLKKDDLPDTVSNS